MGAAVHPQLVIAKLGLRRVAVARGQGRRGQVERNAERNGAQIHQLVGTGHVEGEQALVLNVEAAGDPRQPVATKRLGVDRQRDFERLAFIANVDFEQAGDVGIGNPVGLQFVAGLGCHLVEDRHHLGLVGVGEAARETARGLGPHPGGRIAQRAQHPGRNRRHRRPAAHQPRDRIDMERPRAAKSHQCEIARIIALLDRDHPQRAEHILVDDVDDPARRLHQADAERVGDGLDRRLGAVAVELEGAAEQ